MNRRTPYYQRTLPFELADPSAALSAELSADLRRLKSAATTGDPRADYLLALAYLRGLGTHPNPRIARKHMQTAATAGLALAQFELSLLLEAGIGGTTDPKAAARWEAKAADAGHPHACLNRGARLARAKKPNYAAVIEWYERGALSGSAEAAQRLSHIYAKGEGVPANKARSDRWSTFARDLRREVKQTETSG